MKLALESARSKMLSLYWRGEWEPIAVEGIQIFKESMIIVTLVVV